MRISSVGKTSLAGVLVVEVEVIEVVTNPCISISTNPWKKNLEEQQFDEDLLCWQDLWHLWIPLALNRSAQPADCGRCPCQHFKPQPIFAFTPITHQHTFAELSSSQLQLTCKALRGFPRDYFYQSFSQCVIWFGWRWLLRRLLNFSVGPHYPRIPLGQ